MKIILRKKDSVASIVLFIYNIYNEYTNLNWLELEKLIQLMQYFGKNESATRMGLSRMVKAGILANRKQGSKIIYELTGYGKENLDLWNAGISRFFKRYKKRHEAWHAKWYSLVLLNFDRTNKDSQSIQDEFMELGLREINKYFWLSPYDVSEKISAILSRDRYRYLEMKGVLDTSLDQKELLDDVFQIDVVRKRYKGFLHLIEDTRAEIKKIDHDKGAYLPLLFQLGWNFYNIAVSDPVLPKALLEIWEGDEAVEKMKDTRDYLFKRVSEYFEAMC